MIFAREKFGENEAKLQAVSIVAGEGNDQMIKIFQNNIYS